MIERAAPGSLALLAALPPAPPSPNRPDRPSQVLYAGAHLWKAETLSRAAELARTTLAEAAPDDATFAEIFGLPAAIAREVRPRVAAKLSTQPIEDYRIDFEDGYGIRSDEEEDAAAANASRTLALLSDRGTLPPFIGIRLKSLSAATRQRSFRTLDAFFAARTTSDPPLPRGFVVTLPKVEAPVEVEVLSRALEGHERTSGLPSGSLRLEIMVESPAALVGDDGSFALRRLVLAGGGRCVAAHFGAYDYTASLGIAASDQRLDHPACTLARALIKLSLAGLPVGVSDGATTVLPLSVHRGQALTVAQHEENLTSIRRALALHAGNVDAALREGYTQGWDLHPAQLVARYTAIFAYYARGRAAAVGRLCGFLDRAAQATRLGATFDDAATALGLVQFFLDGIRMGALPRADVEADLRVTPDALASRSFSTILAARRA